MAILINDTTPRAQYTATSGQTVFVVPFEFFANSDLKVYRGTTLQTVGTHYLVTGAGVTGGGSITLASGASAGERITIVRDIPVARTSDFPTSGPFNIDALNTDLDRLTAMIREREEGLTRVLRLAETDTATDFTLPASAARAGRVLAFNATTGNPESGPLIGAVQTVADASADIQTVATNIDSVSVVSGNVTNVNTVAGISGNVTTVAGIAADVTAVAGNAANVTTAATNIASINTAASNITAIQNASANAATATSKAAEAASSATAAASSATTATTQAGIASTQAATASTKASEASASAASAASAKTAAESARDAALAAFDSFDDRYLGPKSADPTLDNDGNALVAGALYFNSTVGEIRVFTGTAWVAAYVSGANFLPLTGGTLTGDLGIGGTFTSYGSTWRMLNIKGQNAAFRLEATTGGNAIGYLSTGLFNDRFAFFAQTAHPLILGTNDVERFRLHETTGAATFSSSVTATAVNTPVLKNASSALNNLMLDANGNVTVAGTVVAGSSMGWRNRIINPGMVVDQRNAGASISAVDGTFAVDRFQNIASAGAKGTAQRNAGSVTPPSGFSNYLGFTTTSAYSVASGDTYAIRHKVEGYNMADFAWGSSGAQTVTLSFWVRSSLTGTFAGGIWNSAQNRSYPFTYTISSANTWEQKVVVVPGSTAGTWLADNGTGLGIDFSLGAGSTYAGTANTWGNGYFTTVTGATSVVGTNGATFYLTGVQLEVGNVATPFERRSFGQELQMALRYFETNYPVGVAPGTGQGVVDGWNFFNGSTLFGEANSFPFTVRKRATPSVTVYGPANGTAGQAYRFSNQTYVSVSLPSITQTRFAGIGAQPVDAYSLFYTANAEL